MSAQTFNGYPVFRIPGDEFQRDPFGNLRSVEEWLWPIKARCVSCGGKGSWLNDVESDHQCRRCTGRGYYFLPLGA